jgi:hypothetical protein
MIVGPEESFSWISKSFVKVDMSNPDYGIVTGDAVRVYAGSQYRGPIHSDRTQLKLNTGDKVRLLGEEKDDYYKISSPKGAYFWIKTKYLTALPGVKEIAPVKIEPTPVKESPVVPADEGKKPDKVTVPDVTKVTEPSKDVTESVVPTMTSEEAQKLEMFYALERLIKAERSKPLEQQDYNDIKVQILQLAGTDQQGKAAKYSQFEARRIERFELALKAAKMIKEQETGLRQRLEQIEQQKKERDAEVTDFGNFAVIGILQKSQVFAHKENVPTYRIATGSGRTLCYAVGQGSIALRDLSSMTGRKVGLMGTIEPHQETGSALVRFEGIKLLR